MRETYIDRAIRFYRSNPHRLIAVPNERPAIFRPTPLQLAEIQSSMEANPKALTSTRRCEAPAPHGARSAWYAWEWVLIECTKETLQLAMPWFLTGPLAIDFLLRQGLIGNPPRPRTTYERSKPVHTLGRHDVGDGLDLSRLLSALGPSQGVPAPKVVSLPRLRRGGSTAPNTARQGQEEPTIK
jgi:hypothetical protein